MTIEEMKARKIELGLTNEMLAQASGVPLGTIEKIMSGLTKAPRKFTIDAIERALAEEPRRRDGNSTGGYAGSFSARDRTSAVRESSGYYTEAAARKRYTLEDYYAQPEDQREELIDGIFYDMSAPSALHQMILGDLYLLFRECADRHGMPCRVILSPFDVRLDRDNYTMVQPDLMICCGDFDAEMNHYEGAPDLTVEILSPATRSKDMILKLYKYQHAGVKEYWIVDPLYRTVTVHDFADENYDPKKYRFDEEIPVRISGGTCRIDFSRVQG